MQQKDLEGAMKLILASTILMLTLGAGGVGAAGQLGGVTSGVKKAGQATKEAGKAATDVTKEAGKAATDVTKEGAKTTKDVVTGKASVKCADGTTQTGK